VTRATIDALMHDRSGLNLASLAIVKIAVTFFSALEEISPRKLDFDHYGIVGRSKTWPDKLGGALPNTQVFISEIEQYRHARKTNAQVHEKEPHALFRHTVEKYLEPGETWLPYGCAEDDATSWWRNEKLGRLLVDRAREVMSALVGNRSSRSSLKDSILPVPIEGVVVTLYREGLCGYGSSHQTELDRALAAAAGRLGRSAQRRELFLRSGELAMTVSILHHGKRSDDTRLLIENTPWSDAVSLLQGDQQFTILPGLVYNGWSRRQFLDALEIIGAGGDRSTPGAHAS
jgi:hypothetical protein